MAFWPFTRRNSTEFEPDNSFPRLPGGSVPNGGYSVEEFRDAILRENWYSERIYTNTKGNKPPQKTDYSDAIYFHFGYINVYGDWAIRRQSRTTYGLEVALQADNATYGTLEAAWNNRKNLTYKDM